ncbi:MAG: lyase family protein [Candidatus Diapherotrites archaeon]|nr:lyase family protein [Candidatus Diapherotrites archaeon]
MSELSRFDAVSPLDSRYHDPVFLSFFSEEARIKYHALVELAAVKALHKLKVCSLDVVQDVEQAVSKVTAKAVYEEEDKIKHDIRALVNVIRKYCKDSSKEFVHLGLTSNDVVNTADIVRYRAAVQEIILPKLKELEKTLIDFAIREKSTVQIGRTHGQHAVPITFGFTLANYIDRLGQSIEALEALNNSLVGKIAGAVGAYNAPSLILENPLKFEEFTLAELNLTPSRISSQVIQPEPLIRLLLEINLAFGILANIADDFRHLQRTEISELFEAFESKQVGSSTMPHKRNPINFENVKSFWKTFMPRVTSLFLDQISEHQRDLTNSASSRFNQEILIAFYLSTLRLNRTIAKLSVDSDRMQKNLETSAESIVAEPLYVLLSKYGCKNAHETVRELTLASARQKKPLMVLVNESSALKSFVQKFSTQEKSILENPFNYTGLAEQKTVTVCNYWKKKLNF